ncbi:MAG TPA: hypothetical protein VM369_03270 [Candidatus Binatia bacterium]|nr:hypothetical protein [Candidatus Binatia bacterium]
MRGIWILALLALTAATPPTSFVGEFDASTAAYKAHDYAGMEAHLRAALAQRPGHPAAQYNLAAALALEGRGAEAVKALETLAAMGLDFAPEQDEDFHALAADGAFKAVVARFVRNRQPVGDARTVLRLTDTHFIPEGVAWDQDSRSFYLGGAHARRIVRLEQRSATLDDNFVSAGVGGLLAPLGMLADSRRRLLWVAHSGIAEMQNAESDELGRAGIVGFDLGSGRARRHGWLPKDGRKHLLGDLARAEKENLYATDSLGGVLYHFDTSSMEFKALTEPGALLSPQGMAPAADGRTVYVADYPRGLFAYDVDKGTLAPVEAAPGVCLYGIDGLYRYKDQLVAVQNGVRPHRVVLLTLDPGGRRVRSAYVLAASLRDMDEPTLGVVVGDRFNFVANGQWHRFDAKHQLPSRGSMSPPVVLRIALNGEHPEGEREPQRGQDRGHRAAPAPQPAPSSPLPVPLPLPGR